MRARRGRYLFITDQDGDLHEGDLAAEPGVVRRQDALLAGSCWCVRKWADLHRISEPETAAAQTFG
jgi:hypothetical protein